jgi:hypothetical protein
MVILGEQDVSQFVFMRYPVPDLDHGTCIYWCNINGVPIIPGKYFVTLQ